jgi:hypothetical protein
MKYQEIHDEYAALLRRQCDCEKTLAGLRLGYVSAKMISGKRYHYLQHWANGRLVSEYIPAHALNAVRSELEERKKREREMEAANERLDRLESAAGLLDGTLRDKLVILRRCAAVDALPMEKRPLSVAFGNAITALEGIPASRSVERNLELWKIGEVSFRDSYLDTLHKYRLMEA